MTQQTNIENLSIIEVPPELRGLSNEEILALHPVDEKKSDRFRPSKKEREARKIAKEQERIDTINKADAIIFQTEQQLKELGDKLPANHRSAIEAALSKLKDAHKAQDIAAIEAAINEIQTAFGAAQQDILNAQQQAQAGAQQAGFNPGAQQGPQGGNGNDNNVTDVDFEEVK